jgi:aminoglycoside phosphotransferase (APT) family kinase protein
MAMVRGATGVAAAVPQYCTRIVEGFDSEVYAVRLAEYPRALIVKIERGDAEVSLDQEAWALGAARGAGVPVPEVLHVGQLVDAAQSLTYLVETQVPGQSLARRLSIRAEPDWRAAFERVGAVLARLHQVWVDGFWKRRSTGEWDFPTWEAVMASTLKNRETEWRELRDSGFTAPEVERVFAGITRYATDFPCRTPVLCHGDLLPEHVFFDDTGRLTGVIDFGMYFGGDPVSDLAVIRMATTDAQVDAIVRGYSTGAALGPRFQLHLHLSLLTTQLGYLLHHMRLPDHPDTAGYADGLRSTLNWLERNG